MHPLTRLTPLYFATKSTAPALTKGFSILNLIAREPGLINLTAIKDRFGLPSSRPPSGNNTMPIGCFVAAARARGYILRLKLFKLGTIAANQRRIEEFALPALKALAQELQLTCLLGIMEGSVAVYLLNVEGNSSIQVNTWVGKRLSLHSSSLSKCYLPGC
ncbi:MAG: IclR family transcriptional regulator domain-containing protein [Candidatus Malihini olakiniferum]